MKEAKQGDAYANVAKARRQLPAGPGTLIGANGTVGVTMAALAVVLSGIDLGREVVDKTGLTGRYDFTLRCAPTYAMRPVINGLVQPLSAEDEALPSIIHT